MAIGPPMRDSRGEADRIGAEELDEMGTHHGGNDGNVPPDGDRSPDPELPELPPEWGDLTIPDDPSELAAEAEQIQSELARERLEGSARRRSTGSAAGDGRTEPSIGVPLLIMSVAVLITLVSLFAMAWSGSGTAPRGGSGTAGGDPDALPPITLVDAASRQVALAAQTPLAILLVEECACPGLLTGTVAAAPPGVTVAAVGHTPPSPPTGLEPSDPAPLLLADPAGEVRAGLGLDPPTDAATVVLVARDGQILQTHRAATSVAQFQGDLTSLGSGG